MRQTPNKPHLDPKNITLNLQVTETMGVLFFKRDSDYEMQALEEFIKI